MSPFNETAKRNSRASLVRRRHARLRREADIVFLSPSWITPSIARFWPLRYVVDDNQFVPPGDIDDLVRHLDQHQVVEGWSLTCRREHPSPELAVALAAAHGWSANEIRRYLEASA